MELYRQHEQTNNSRVSPNLFTALSLSLSPYIFPKKNKIYMAFLFFYIFSCSNEEIKRSSSPRSSYWYFFPLCFYNKQKKKKKEASARPVFYFFFIFNVSLVLN
jgi:hypothetical protein